MVGGLRETENAKVPAPSLRLPRRFAPRNDGQRGNLCLWLVELDRRATLAMTKNGTLVISNSLSRTWQQPQCMKNLNRRPGVVGGIHNLAFRQLPIGPV